MDGLEVMDLDPTPIGPVAHRYALLIAADEYDDYNIPDLTGSQGNCFTVLFASVDVGTQLYDCFCLQMWNALRLCWSSVDTLLSF